MNRSVCRVMAGVAGLEVLGMTAARPERSQKVCWCRTPAVRCRRNPRAFPRIPHSPRRTRCVFWLTN